MTTQQHLDTLSQLNIQVQPWHDRFSEIADLVSLKTAFSEKLTRFALEELQLNIAVMGQVKAGKSSFLNALLFDGRPVLPTAATPKTANLTRISYGEQPVLEIEYYQPEEWQDICQLATQQGGTDHIKVACELVEMVKLPPQDVQSLLAQGKERIEASNLDDLMGRLNQYAGNDGTYTALVKMIRLYLPIEELKGFDVIDTPGMNDPVLSRTQKTKEEMARCDVVFFLSRSGQFLDQSDIHLLANQLPQSGVKRMVLVAGQYDALLLDDGFNRDSLAKTEANLTKRIYDRAEKEMGKLAEQRRQAGRVENAALLEQLTKPILSSTFAHGFVNWPKERWSEAMQHVHGNLLEMAEDEWGGYQWTKADWLRIASFEQLTQAYQQARNDKQQLLQCQRESILPEAKLAFTDVLGSLKMSVERRINTLRTQDIAELEKQQQVCELQIKRISLRLEDVIENQLGEINEQQREITQELKQSMSRYDQLKTRTGTETNEVSYTVSTSRWYNPFSWGSSETRYRTVSVNYQYLNASDAIEQINRYARDCRNDIENNFNGLISIHKLKLDLRRTLVEELQTKRADFDPANFRATLERAINRLELPVLKLDMDDMGQQISRQFKDEIRSSDQMDMLKRQFNQALSDVFEQMTKSFAQSICALAQELKTVQQGLQHDLTQSVRDELTTLKEDFDKHSQALDDYVVLLDIVSGYINGNGK